MLGLRNGTFLLLRKESINRCIQQWLSTATTHPSRVQMLESISKIFVLLSLVCHDKSRNRKYLTFSQILSSVVDNRQDGRHIFIINPDKIDLSDVNFKPVWKMMKNTNHFGGIIICIIYTRHTIVRSPRNRANTFLWNPAFRDEIIFRFLGEGKQEAGMNKTHHRVSENLVQWISPKSPRWRLTFEK